MTNETQKEVLQEMMAAAEKRAYKQGVRDGRFRAVDELAVSLYRLMCLKRRHDDADLFIALGRHPAVKAEREKFEKLPPVANSSGGF